MNILIRISVVAFLFCAIAVKPVNATEVIGDNDLVAYVGTGGLLLPSSFSGSSSTKTSIADCKGCTWAYTIYCMYDSEGLCQHSTSSCPVGQLKYRVWFGRTADALSVVGSVCWGAGKPPTRREIENRLDDLVINYVPNLQLEVAPPGGTLTSVPVIGWVNQAETYEPPEFLLAGRTVQITAFANWRWNWGDGTIEWKGIPGLPYPNTSIAHQYREPGSYSIEVTTVWQAKYQVAGIGTYTVGGDVLTQSDQQPIDVRSTKAVLMRH